MFRTQLAFALALIASPALAAGHGQPGAHFIENWDLNADGAVTVAEATERRADVFLTFDANEDGFLDVEEYVMFDEARAIDMAENGGAKGHGGKGLKNAADGMKLENNDTDGDGRVSREEFIANAPGWIAEMDRNGDGVITNEDFGQRRG